MKLWFKKQNEGNVAETSAATPVPVASSVPETAGESAKPAFAAGQDGVSASAVVQPQKDKIAVSVPIRPKQGQKALYYQMMNALYDAVLILDDNGHVVDCNERVPSVLGHTREELWDVPVTDLIPGISSQIFEKMKTGLHGNRRVLLNARCHRKDGSTFSGEVGAGLIDLIGENLVLTIRNIEKRAPVKAIVRPAATP